MAVQLYVPQINIDSLKNWYQNNTEFAKKIVNVLPLPYASSLERIILGENITPDWLRKVWASWHGWLEYTEITPFEDYLQITFDTMLRILGRKTDDLMDKIIKGEQITKEEQSTYLMHLIRAANLIHSEREIQRYLTIATQSQQPPAPYSP